MKTIIQKIDATNMASSDFKEAAGLLRAGKLVAFPTETVYGLAGNALDPEASAKIYAAKGRPSDNPLIVHIARLEDLPYLVKEIPDCAYRLAESFWPGPLTIILPKSAAVPDVTSGVAVSSSPRMGFRSFNAAAPLFAR